MAITKTNKTIDLMSKIKFLNFRDLKIGKRLTLGFLVVIILVGVIGVIAYSNFQHLGGEMEEVVKENWPASQYISEMRESVREHSTAHSEYIEAALSKQLGASDEDVEAHYKLGNEMVIAAMDKFNRNIEAFEKTELYKEVAAAAAAADMNILMDLERKLEAAYRAGDHELAEKVMDEFDDFLEATDENLAKIQTTINQKMTEMVEDVARDIAAATMFIIIITIIIVIFGLGISFLISSSISKPIGNLSQTAQKISEGDLTLRSEIQSKDEIGNLASSFNQMTDSLLEARKFPENIIRSMTESLMVATPEAKIKEVNQATLDLLGYERKELIGQPIEKVFGRAAAAAAAAETIFRGVGLEKLIKEGFVKNVEMTYQTKKGKEIPVSVSGSVMKDEKGKMIGIVVAAKDMRVYKELEGQKVAAAAAAAAEKSKRELAEKMAGELEQKVKERTSELQASEQQLKAANQQLRSAMEELEMARAGLEKRVEERTAELAGKVAELEEWRDVTTGRELKMMELKEEMKRLRKKCGEPVGRIEKEMELPPLPKAPPAPKVVPKIEPVISPDKRQDEEIKALKEEIKALKAVQKTTTRPPHPPARQKASGPLNKHANKKV